MRRSPTPPAMAMRPWSCQRRMRRGGPRGAAAALDDVLDVLVDRMQLLRHGVSLDEGVGLDLDQHARVDQAADLDHRGRRADVGEDLAVGAADLLPAGDVGDVHARAHHVVQARADALERRRDVGDRAAPSARRVAPAATTPCSSTAVQPATHTCGARAHDARVADDRLPGAGGARSQALSPSVAEVPALVKTIATPASSAAATTSSSRTEPPGWMIAVDAGLDRQLGPVGEREERVGGQRRALQRLRRATSRPRGARSRRGSSARRRCRRSRRSRASTIALDFTCWQTRQAKSRSLHSSSVGGAR